MVYSVVLINPHTPRDNNTNNMQNPITGLNMAGFIMTPNYLGVSNTVVRDLMFNAARRGICIGNYNTAIWADVAATVPSLAPVLYNSEYI